MENTGKLKGRTIFITGASRGIGKEIAVKCAKDGANIVVAAKTGCPRPKLKGTIHTAAKEVKAAGGRCLPIVMDVRDEQCVMKAINAAVKHFGGIDILVNNASAIILTATESTDMKKYDLMHRINVRGTFLTTKHCIPHLRASKFGGKILNHSPPLVMSSRWFAPNLAYTMTKFGMSMCALGMAEEFRSDNIAVNTIWPKTMIATAATEMLTGDKKSSMEQSRSPAIMADAAYGILCRPNSFTGNFCIDEDVLREEGVRDFDVYAAVPGAKPQLDFFLPEEYYDDIKSKL
ncbi:hydroxysteroid dehydrogenase-like protein 2 [Galendromus occidentalis]|uniref:Hydroxysteroid dehydrogenase-like protein 2 n=1 Tax=Galendromus occidentalis TaxID=34638 RepID=A0AAJ6QYY3_9ACAR|nr:hydroxysteroid dehydrogenase-like protein 2 [Galendromus occidentalis]